MITLNALFPIFLLICLGNLLHRFGYTSKSYLDTSDRLIYYIFFPVLLFWKIGGSSQAAGFDFVFIAASQLVLGIAIILSLVIILCGPVTNFQAGSFAQSCYRFNTYIGVAVVLNSMGETGIAYFGILIAFAIPIVNVCAVLTLIWFAEEKPESGKKSAIVMRALVSNPLIIGCLLGLLYARFFNSFPSFIDNGLQMMSMVTLPLALISIGGMLTFKEMSHNLNLSLLAAICKLVILPVTGYLVYRLVGVEGVAFKVGMIFFCLPASTALYVLSSQLNSDKELASSAIVVSTVLSFFSLSVALLLQV
ncbi:MAG: AEC family transporter [Desulfocapsaceae bacterium]|jgi:predicted permease|nr:AEC family transporter [Desulfocapsaceae bacterium]